MLEHKAYNCSGISFGHTFCDWKRMKLKDFVIISRYPDNLLDQTKISLALKTKDLEL